MTTAHKHWFAAALVATGFALVFWRVFGALVMAWYTDDNYSHGFLIIPLAAYLAWERRDRLWAAAERPVTGTPLVSTFDGMAPALTVTGLVALVMAPALSVTVSVTLRVPAVA